MEAADKSDKAAAIILLAPGTMALKTLLTVKGGTSACVFLSPEAPAT